MRSCLSAALSNPQSIHPGHCTFTVYAVGRRHLWMDKSRECSNRKQQGGWNGIKFQMVRAVWGVLSLLYVLLRHLPRVPLYPGVISGSGPSGLDLTQLKTSLISCWIWRRRRILTHKQRWLPKEEGGWQVLLAQMDLNSAIQWPECGRTPKPERVHGNQSQQWGDAVNSSSNTAGNKDISLLAASGLEASDASVCITQYDWSAFKRLGGATHRPRRHLPHTLLFWISFPVVGWEKKKSAKFWPGWSTMGSEVRVATPQSLLVGDRGRSVTFVVDASEDMRGILASAKRLLIGTLLRKAAFRDSLFNIVTFSTQVTVGAAQSNCKIWCDVSVGNLIICKWIYIFEWKKVYPVDWIIWIGHAWKCSEQLCKAKISFSALWWQGPAWAVNTSSTLQLLSRHVTS